MRLPTLAALAASLLLIAADAPDDANKKDLDKLQGTWKVESAESEGRPYPVEKLAVQGMTFNGDKLIDIANGTPRPPVTVKLDAAKTPAAIDFVDNDGKAVKQGIYQFDGDALKMAFAANANLTEGRPSEPVSKPGSQVVVFTLKHEKK